MREFKFRVWDRKEKRIIKFVIGDDIKRYSDKDIGVWLKNYHKKVKYFELMLYTGLKDKYDDEIYEGDIVKDEIDEEIGYVEFSEGEYRIIYDNIAIILNRDEAFYIEVIGNIYENKEFLGDKI